MSLQGAGAAWKADGCKDCDSSSPLTAANEPHRALNDCARSATKLPASRACSTSTTTPPMPDRECGRRRLLGMIKYVPPIVIGAITLEQAGCQPAGSCAPNGGCPPSGGGPRSCPPPRGVPPSPGLP